MVSRMQFHIVRLLLPRRRPRSNAIAEVVILLSPCNKSLHTQIQYGCAYLIGIVQAAAKLAVTCRRVI